MRQSKAKEYFKPLSLKEAVKLCKEYEGNLIVVAGATDVFAVKNNTVDAFVDIMDTGISYINKEDGIIKIGAATTFEKIIKSEVIKNEAYALWQAAKGLADMTVRNMATIGGNICTAVPSGDSIVPIIAYDADFVIASTDGEKKVKAGEFFVGPRKTILQKGEILKEIQIKAEEKGEGAFFLKEGRNSEDIAIVNVCAWVKVDENNKIIKARVSNGAVAPTVVRASKLEETLADQMIDEEKLEQYCELIKEDISPITNVRGTAEYRTDCSVALTKRALSGAYLRAGKEQ